MVMAKALNCFSFFYVKYILNYMKLGLDLSIYGRIASQILNAYVYEIAPF